VKLDDADVESLTVVGVNVESGNGDVAGARRRYEEIELLRSSAGICARPIYDQAIRMGQLYRLANCPKLGIDVGQTSVAKYMARGRRGPSQGWRTFLCNHADGIASVDLFVVPTVSFRLLYGFLMLRHGRRRIMWLGVTANPTAEWIARQLTEACGWERAPDYIVRDRDCVYGKAYVRRLRAMGIRDRPTAPRSPRQNAYAERLIGSIRRELLDHIVVFGERHLRQVLSSYMMYYNEARTHQSLDKDTPVPREIQAVGRILAKPHLGGLHHQYVRI
jgi:Integrase core domain